MTTVVDFVGCFFLFVFIASGHVAVHGLYSDILCLVACI